MVAVGGGVDTLFSGGGVYFSPDGRNIGGGGHTDLAYTGSQRVVQMVGAGGGVDTLFSGGGVYFSPDGWNIGGGGHTDLAYTGSQRVVQMVGAGDGVVTLFSGGGVYFSPDGWNIGGGGHTSLLASGVASFTNSGVGNFYFTLNPATLPAGTAGNNYSAQLLATGLYGSFGFRLVSGALPTGLHLGNGGVVSGTATHAATYNFTFEAVNDWIPGVVVTQPCTLTVNPAAPSRFVVSAPGSAAAGASFGVTITAYDPYGNVASNYSGTLTLTCSNGQVLSVPVTQGAASKTMVINTAGTFTLTATSGGVRGTTSIKIYWGQYLYQGYVIAYDDNGDRLAQFNYSFDAQNDNQFAQILANYEAAWGQQLDESSDTEDWSTMIDYLQDKTGEPV
jgi:hypothetical protein